MTLYEFEYSKFALKIRMFHPRGITLKTEIHPKNREICTANMLSLDQSQFIPKRVIR